MKGFAICASSELHNNTEQNVLYESRFDKADIALEYLDGKRAVQTYANTIFKSNQKSFLEHNCINIGEESLLPKETFEALFDTKVICSENKILIDDGVQMTVGDTKLVVNGKQIDISNAPEIRNGVLYLPAVAYGKAVLKDGKFLNDHHGMLLVGSDIKKECSGNKAANLYLFFERKSAEKLKEQFIETNNQDLQKHPRIMLTKERVQKLREEIKTDTYKMKWFEMLRTRADEYCRRNPSSYTLSDGRLLNLANATLSRTEVVAFVYQMTMEEKYAESVLAELEALCSFPNWDPEHFLDLATIATTFAIGYDWIYDYISEEQRKCLACKAQKFAAQKAKTVYLGVSNLNDFFWNTETNWGIITHGGISNLLLATAEYNTDECMEILRDALRAMEFTWYRFAPDGAWYEGPGYWTYMLTHLCRFLGAYETSMGEVYGKKYRGLDKYGYFQCYFMGPDALPNNFHDADSYNIQNEGQFVLAKMFEDVELMRYRRQQMEQYDLEPTAIDVIYYSVLLSGEDNQIVLNSDCYYRETEFVAMREKWGDKGSAWLSYHGGEVHNAHDHVDAGTFVFCLGGVRWAVDLGKEPLSYGGNDPATLSGYSTKHYYRIRTEGHNNVVINPDEGLGMKLGSFSKASVIQGNINEAFGTVDLSEAYSADTSGYIRGFMLKDSRRTLIIRDEITLLKKSEIYWFMHTEGEIRIIDNETAIISQAGKALKVQFHTNAQKAKLAVMNAVSLPGSPHFNMSANERITKFIYHLHAEGKVTITVKMALLDETGSKTGVKDIPITQGNSMH